MPCYNPPRMEKGLTLNTKISQFLYIKLPLLALVQEYLISHQRISIFTFYFFFFWLPLAVPIVQRTLHHCKYDLSQAVQQLWWTFFFHITKLQFYSHMFKFQFLFSNPLTKYLLLSAYPSSSLLKASELLFFCFSMVGVQGEAIREQ